MDNLLQGEIARCSTEIVDALRNTPSTYFKGETKAFDKEKTIKKERERDVYYACTEWLRPGCVCQSEGAFQMLDFARIDSVRGNCWRLRWTGEEDHHDESIHPGRLWTWQSVREAEREKDSMFGRLLLISDEKRKKNQSIVILGKRVVGARYVFLLATSFHDWYGWKEVQGDRRINRDT